jgi:hypothetical protein
VPIIKAIHAQNNEICIIDFRPEKTEYSYFLRHVSVLLFYKRLYFCQSFKNYLENRCNFLIRCPICVHDNLKCSTQQRALVTTLKKHILSKVLCGQSSANPFYAYLNNNLAFHLISELCDFYYVLKIKAMPI